MRAERIWQQALQLSSQAEASGSLVPLATEVLPVPQHQPFVLRLLLSTTPKHLRPDGPKPNPFLPWEEALEVERLSSGHVVLLNKYPVQAGHLLLITDSWQPQSGWLSGAVGVSAPLGAMPEPPTAPATGLTAGGGMEGDASGATNGSLFGAS